MNEGNGDAEGASAPVGERAAQAAPSDAAQAAAGAIDAGSDAPAEEGGSYPPEAVLLRALEKGAQAAATDRSGEPLAVVLGRAFVELRDGGLSDDTGRTLRAALSAAQHNGQLAGPTRTALAAVSVALRGLGQK